MLSIPILTQLEYLLRILVAMVCGGVIGFEREHRVKSAGLKTHMIVSMGAALMMIISKYGFVDVLVDESVKLDPSRVAAGIVSAIGFLGAGVIFARDFKVTGVTTAAGLWTTVGVGMVLGAGFYFIGAVSTLLVVLTQLTFRHVHIKLRNRVVHISITAEGEQSELHCLQEEIKKMSATIIRTTLSACPEDTGRFRTEMMIILIANDYEQKMMYLFHCYKSNIKSISFEER